MPKTATLTKLPIDYVKCRGYGHAWDWVSDESLVRDSRKKVIEYTEVLRCLRCDTHRYDQVTLLTHDLVKRRYARPVEYDLAKPGRTLRREVLKEFANRRKIA